jgi:hypothetical protein
MTVPEEIVKYLWSCGTSYDSHINKIIEKLKDHSLDVRFYKKPSFESEQVNNVEFAVYRAFEELEDSCAEVTPKYELNFVETVPGRTIGFTNSFSSSTYAELYPALDIAMDAYRRL